jgi:hypothetical protein
MEKLRIKLEERFGSEDNVVSAWNEYVENNMETKTKTQNIKFYLNDVENIANIISNMSKEGIAKSIAQSSSAYACYDSMDRYVYEIDDRLYSINSIYAVISQDALERFYAKSALTKEDRLKTLCETATNVLGNYSNRTITMDVFNDCCENIVREFVEIMENN